MASKEKWPFDVLDRYQRPRRNGRSSLSPGLAMWNRIEQKPTATDPAMDWLALEFPWAVSEIYTARAQISERERLFRMAPADFAFVIPASEAMLYSVDPGRLVNVNVSVDTKGLSTSLEDVMALLKKQFGQDVDVFRSVDDELAYRIEVQSLGTRNEIDPVAAEGIRVATDYFTRHAAIPVSDNAYMKLAELDRQHINAKADEYVSRFIYTEEPKPILPPRNTIYGMVEWQNIALPANFDPPKGFDRWKADGLEYPQSDEELAARHASQQQQFVEESSPLPESRPRKFLPSKYRQYEVDDPLTRAIEKAQQRYVSAFLLEYVALRLYNPLPVPAWNSPASNVVPVPEDEQSVAHLPVEQRLAFVMNEVHRRFNADVISREVFIKWRRLHYPKILIRVASVHSMAMHCLFHRCDIKHDAVTRLEPDWRMENDGTLPIPEPHEVWQVWDEQSTHTDYRCAQVCSIDQRLKAKATDDSNPHIP